MIANIEKRLGACDERTFRRFAILGYLVFAAANVLTHEMWRDELQAWMISAASNSIPELFHNLRYDGHPPLWYLMLYVVTRFTSDPFWMQVLHLSIALGTAYVFIRFAPFTRLQRLLFVFGYFPLYEYAAISRNYAIGILLLFIFCSVFRAGAGKRYWLLALLLLVLAQTNAYGFVLAVTLTGMMVFEAMIDKSVRVYARSNVGMVTLSAFIIAAGLAASVMVMKPSQSDALNGDITTQFETYRAQETLCSIWKSIIPVPRITHCYWNRNLFPGRTTPYYLAIGLLVPILLLFQRKPVIFIFLLTSLCAMLLLMYLVYLGFMRHFGHIYVVLIMCLWLERGYKEGPAPQIALLRILSNIVVKHKEQCLYAVLIIHALAGLHASVMEWCYPFSQAKNTAAFIRQKHLDQFPMLGDVPHCASSVAGYLGKPMYYARTDEMGTFIVYEKKMGEDLPEHELLEKAGNLSQNRKQDILMVQSRKLSSVAYSVTEIASFEDSLQRDENFYLYLMKYRTP